MSDQKKLERVAAGGKAAEGGVGYELATAAWVAVHILAGHAGQPLSVFGSNRFPVKLKRQTGLPVDDWWCELDDKSVCYAQAKRTVSLDSKLHARAGFTQFGSALDQAVRQCIADRATNVSGAIHIVTRNHGGVAKFLRPVLQKIRQMDAQDAGLNACGNAQQRGAYDLTKKHVESLYLRHTNKTLDAPDLHEFFRRLHVTLMDVENGEADHRLALQLLGNHILVNASQAEVAWNILLAACRGATGAAVLDRGILQKKLLDAGLELQAVREYRVDLERLGQVSTANLKYLEEHAKSPAPSSTIEIKREIQAQLPTDISFLVVGEAGIGKSAILAGFASQVAAHGKRVFVIRADSIDWSSLLNVRTSLGLKYPLDEILPGVPGGGTIIVDGLDAARGTAPMETVIQLLQALSSLDNWNVVATIRSYDIRYTQGLRKIFCGSSPLVKHADPNLDGVAHVAVSRLTDEEIGSARIQSSELDAALSSNSELVALCRNTFNLSLLCRLLESVPRDQLATIRTQIDLLDHFWRARVLDPSDGDADARAETLRSVVQRMVCEGRLEITRGDLPMAGSLLAATILEERAQPSGRANRNCIRFAHNAFFDWAVSEEFLSGTQEDTIRFLSQNPHFIFQARPSFVFQVVQRWNHDPSRLLFWDFCEAVQRSELPAFIKLIAPEVSAEQAVSINEFQPLLHAALDQGSFACALLQQLVYAIADDRVLRAQKRILWIELATEISRRLNEASAPILGQLLSKLVADGAAERALGAAAQALLEWALTNEHTGLTDWSVELVCRTFGSAPHDAASALKFLEEPQGDVPRLEELQGVAGQLGHIIPYDTQFVERIYEISFKSLGRDRFSGIQDEETAFSLAERENLDGLRHALARSFPAFLARDPPRALGALRHAIRHYRSAHNNRPTVEAISPTFTEEARVTILPDRSGIWDSTPSGSHDPVVKMLDEYQRCLTEAAGKSDDSAANELISAALGNPIPASLVRRLLRCGAVHPVVVGRAILHVALDPVVLTHRDTRVPAAMFLAAIQPYLDEAQSIRSEQAIIDLPLADPYDSWAEPGVERDRILGCLDPQFLVTDRARQQFIFCHAVTGFPANREAFRITGFRTSGLAGAREFGLLPPETDEESVLDALAKPIRQFTDLDWKGSSPGSAVAQQLIPTMERVHRQLIATQSSSGNAPGHIQVWDQLLDACEKITRVADWDAIPDLRQAVIGIVSDGAYHPIPGPESFFDVNVDAVGGASWGRPAPRVVAAQALVALARQAQNGDDAVWTSFDSLSADPNPNIRYIMARGAEWLLGSHPARAWRLAEKYARNDESAQVREAIAASLHGFIQDDRERGLQLLWSIDDDMQKRAVVSNIVLDLLLEQFLLSGSTKARHRIEEWLAQSSLEADPAGHILFIIRRWRALTDERAAVRNRAWEIYIDVAKRAHHQLTTLGSENSRTSRDKSSPSVQKEHDRARARIANIGTQVYYASGAWPPEHGTDGAESGASDGARRAQFWADSKPVLEILASHQSARSADHVLETVAFLADANLREALLLAERSMKAETSHGIQSIDSYLRTALERLLRTSLTQGRHILRESTEANRAFTGILDSWIGTGSSQARLFASEVHTALRA